MTRRKSTPKTLWGQHSKAYRDRVARQAAERHGLTRRQARERYNRGTFKPELSKRSPGFIKNPTPTTLKTNPRPKRFSERARKRWAKIQAPRTRNPQGEHVRIKGFPKEIPDWLYVMSDLDDGGYWVNPFWYHNKSD